MSSTNIKYLSLSLLFYELQEFVIEPTNLSSVYTIMSVHTAYSFLLLHDFI